MKHAVVLRLTSRFAVGIAFGSLYEAVLIKLNFCK